MTNVAKGMLLVLCAPSGAGKSTLIHRLTAEFPHFSFSVSCTTRPPRAGEMHGRDYFFLSKEEFRAQKAQGFFAECAEVHGNFYGTPRQSIEDMLSKGQDVLFDIDVQGAAQIKTALPSALFVFIFPPSRPILAERLRLRGTETEASITKRLDTAAKEIAESFWFDHWIINDRLETAYDHLRSVYLAQKTRPLYSAQQPETLLKDWE